MCWSQGGRIAVAGMAVRAIATVAKRILARVNEGIPQGLKP
jgi:hypothetical protein